MSVSVVIMKLSAVTTQRICRQAGTSGGAGNYGAGVNPKWACASGRSTAEFSAPFFIHEEWTVYLSESLCKGFYLPHIRLVLPYLIEIPSMPLQSKIGACGVSLSGLPISNRDIAARGYPVISGWGQIRSPFAHSKRGKPHIFPRKIGAMPVRVQICSRKIPGTGWVCFHWWLCSARLHFKSNL